MPQILVARMSWVVYLRPISQIVFLLGISIIYLAYWEEARSFLRNVLPSTPSIVPILISQLPLLAFITGILKAIWKVCLNRSLIIIIGLDGVEYRAGILPWKRHENFWKYDQIFTAMYATKPEFLGWLFRFGALIIVGREGSTREYRIDGLHNPRRAQSLICSRAEG